MVTDKESNAASENVNTYSVVISTELTDDAKMIRERVFMDEQGFTTEFDELDKISRHIVAYIGDRPAGTCRIYEDADSFTREKEFVYILGRLAVLKEFRGEHIGVRLMRDAVNLTKMLGGTVLRLHAQCQARGFYEKLGFHAYGEIDYDEDCPHIWMECTLHG